MRIAKAAIRTALDRAGYWSVHRSIMPFGIDYLQDIHRLSERHGIAINRAFDVGAHSGQTANEFLEAFPGAEVHSFEPHPAAFSFLSKIMSPRLRKHELAISSRCGEADLFVSSDQSTDAMPSTSNTLVANTQLDSIVGQRNHTIKVECTTIDRFCEQNAIDAVDLLKVDTEGHDAEVLEGAQKTLAQRGVRLILIEFQTILPVAHASGGSLAQIAAHIEPHGFKLVAAYQIHMLHDPLYAAFNALYAR